MLQDEYIDTKTQVSISNKSPTSQWIWPFIDNTMSTPQTKVGIDGQDFQVTVDTGASRFMITSAKAAEIWGTKYRQHLEPFYANRQVKDAQNKAVNIHGVKISEITIGPHLKVKYPLIVYEASHKEVLMGYSFLEHYDLAVYPGRGIGTQPELNFCQRLNIDDTPMKCFAKQSEYIPAKATKIVKVRVEFPQSWSIKDRMECIGEPVVTHSEDVECLPVGCLTCPYTYDIIRQNDELNVVVDNTANFNPMYIEENQLIANADFCKINHQMRKF